MLYSIFTLVTPELVQVILCTEPTCQFSPPLGEVTVIVGVGLMVKTLSLSSTTEEKGTSVILTLHCADGKFGIVHEYIPDEAGVLPTIVDQVEPLFVVYSIFTLVTPELVQVILCAEPTCQFSPPLGALTNIDDCPPILTVPFM